MTVFDAGKISGVRVMANAIKIYCIENNIRLSETEIEMIEDTICNSISDK